SRRRLHPVSPTRGEGTSVRHHRRPARSQPGTAGALPRPASRHPVQGRSAAGDQEPRPPVSGARGLDLDVERRLPERVEVTTYYVAAEALTNAAKHAHASTVTLSVAADACGVRLSVQDDGVGGADLGNGSGLIGLKDRVEAIGGRMRISSINQRGTTLIAEMPLQ